MISSYLFFYFISLLLIYCFIAYTYNSTYIITDTKYLLSEAINKFMIQWLNRWMRNKNVPFLRTAGRVQQSHHFETQKTITAHVTFFIMK